MRTGSLFLLVLIVTAGCHSAGSVKPPQLIAVDTNKEATLSDTSHKNEMFLPPKTHLKDTTRMSGNELLFLCPDPARYDSLAANEDNEMGTVSEDFEVGIRNTLDSVKANKKYKNIKVWISVQRYILIKDCKNGPLLIDRDTVTYGYILSGPGRAVGSVYNSVHSGDYLGKLDEYFDLQHSIHID